MSLAKEKCFVACVGYISGKNNVFVAVRYVLITTKFYFISHFTVGTNHDYQEQYSVMCAIPLLCIVSSFGPV